MQYKHISKAVEETLEYIKNRREGKEQPLYTKFTKLNKVIDGFNWGRIYTIAGLSGSGKSITIEQIKRDLVDSNEEDFEILSFEFEMLAMDQIARNISGKTNLGVDKIYSYNKEKLNRENFEIIKSVAKELNNYPIFYVDNVGSVKDIMNTILSFVEERSINNKKGLIVTIDHILLTKGMYNQNEKEIIDDLMHQCVEMKKYFSSKGIKVMWILLSQLNRDIEKQERVMNPLFHYPTKSDIFAASSVYYCSDVVIIIHRPSVIEGIGKYYGVSRESEGYPKGLPLVDETRENKPMVYFHIIKSRFGENKILLMVGDFANSRIIEF